jgi:hypothetical protein
VSLLQLLQMSMMMPQRYYLEEVDRRQCERESHRKGLKFEQGPPA